MPQLIIPINNYLEGQTLVCTVYDLANTPVVIGTSYVVTDLGDGSYVVNLTYPAQTNGYAKVLDGTTVLGSAALIPANVENADILSSQIDTKVDGVIVTVAENQDLLDDIVVTTDETQVVVEAILAIMEDLELDDLTALLARLRAQSNAQSQIQ